MLILEKMDCNLLKLLFQSGCHLNTLFCAITDVSVRARQVWENRSKEKFRELQQENWSLNKAYQAVVQQYEGTKQLIEEQQLKLKRLEEENKRLKEAAENSPRGGGRNI